MLKVSLLLLALLGSSRQDAATDQIVTFANSTEGPIGIITTSAGAPIEYKDTETTLNKNLIGNEFFMDSITHLVRENIPGRILQGKGAGAFGYFETTNDISHICKADLFSEVGKQTPVAVRFSMGVVENGGSDLTREVKGFSVKFYTTEGNLDLLGLNAPIFVAKNPTLIVPFVHAIKRNPRTFLKDPNTFWDFMTLHPESLYLFLMVLGDPGIPDGYRHMPMHPIHTFEVYNATGAKHFVRFHFYPEAGLKNLNSTQAAAISARDSDYSTRDMYDTIANGGEPSWILNAQILTQDDVDNASFDVFDVSRSLPESLYPMQEVGRLVLNRNPENYYAEVEQLAFSPGNLVPGILGGPDQVFEVRRFVYRDAQLYRLGANFNKIQVNCPYRTTTNTYNRDGVPSVNDNEGGAPNYYPNSFNGAVAYVDEFRPSLSKIFERAANNTDQARDYYTNDMASDEKDRLVSNIVGSLCYATGILQTRAVHVFSDVSTDLGDRVSAALEANNCSS